MTTPEPAGNLAAKTSPISDVGEPLTHLGAHGFAWIHDSETIITSGIAAEVAAHDVVETLEQISGDTDDIIACGALPFMNTNDATMIIPHRVLRIDSRGARVTEITPAVAERSSSWARVPQRFTVESLQDLTTWDTQVATALAHIEDGLFHKVVLAREVRVAADTPFAAAPILVTLRATQPGCFVYADRGFLGASPELLVRRRGNAVTARPMAGTVPRQPTLTADDAAIEALRTSLKNNNEHRFVVDAVMDALRAYCNPLTASDAEPVRLTTVTHLTTSVVGTLLDGCVASALDLALALHPTPAVGGTPQLEAIKAIAELEPFDRGRYAGPVGWVNARGDGEFAVALRCAELVDNTARLIAGAGIVDGSDPDEEWAETQAKLEPMLRALVRP